MKEKQVNADKCYRENKVGSRMGLLVVENVTALLGWSSKTLCQVTFSEDFMELREQVKESFPGRAKGRCKGLQAEARLMFLGSEMSKREMEMTVVFFVPVFSCKGAGWGVVTYVLPR